MEKPKSGFYKGTFVQYLALMAVVLLSSSCGRSIYVPNAVNAPLLSDSGEVQANVMTGTDGFGGQAAYALTKHIGLIGDFSHSTNGTRHTESKKNYKNRNVNTISELGIGYFQKLSIKNRFEIYGGLGKDYRFLNNFSKRIDSISYSHIENKCNLACSKLFLQADIGRVTRFAEFSFGARLVGLDFQSYKYNSLYLDARDNVVKVTATQNHNPVAFLEPVLSMRFRYRSVKFFYQMGMAMPLGASLSRKQPDSMEPLFLNIGLSFRIPGKY